MYTARLPRIAFGIALALTATGCAGSENRSAAVPVKTAATGAIEGGIQHPAHATPSMRICAIGDAPSVHVCTRTPAHQSHYRIDGVPPGEYQVFATADNPLYPVGGHVQSVQCIRAPCPSMPASVTVTAGATTTGVDLNGFYDKRDDFPAMPAGD